MIEVIVSDFGGVLTTPLEGSFRRFAEVRGIPLERLGEALAGAYQDTGVHPLHALERGEMTEADFLADLSERVGAPMDGFAQTFMDGLEVNDELVAELRAQRDAGLRLALCTNNVREWEPLWRTKLPIDELFEFVVDSGFVGVRKPDRGIFDIVLERLGGVAPETCVLVDDFAINCEGARAVGMAAVHFVDNDQAIPELRALLADRR